MTDLVVRTVPGDHLARLDCEALYTAISRERRARRIRGNREVLRQAGIKGTNLLTRLGHGDPPGTDNLIRLLLWLGTTDLAPFIARSQP